MSCSTTGASKKNDSSLENLHFYARVDTTSSGRYYSIMKKDNADQLSINKKYGKQ